MIVYADESGMDNQDQYDYGWKEKGKRFHALKSGIRKDSGNNVIEFSTKSTAKEVLTVLRTSEAYTQLV